MGFSTLFVLAFVLMILIRFVNQKLDSPQDSNQDDASIYENHEEEPAFETQDNTEPVVEPEAEPQAAQPSYSWTADIKTESAEPEPKRKPATTRSYSQYAYLFGLIGKPLGHSTSKARFNNMFQSKHMSAYYENFELESADEVKELVDRNPNLCGFNVTIPYKEDIIPQLTRLDETAQAIGAVNTVKVIHKDSGTELIGYNTDWIGFTESFKELLEGKKKALILGTGGVSKAVKYALDKLGIENRFVSRNSSFDIMGYYELSPSVMDEYDVIVNCTPLGMWPQTEQCPDIPYTFLSEDHVLLDVIANPDETMFMRKGREHGAQAKGGKDMLEQQAVAAWNIWNSIEI
jgi:shikimate dehydrogenase